MTLNSDLYCCISQLYVAILHFLTKDEKMSQVSDS